MSLFVEEQIKELTLGPGKRKFSGLGFVDCWAAKHKLLFKVSPVFSIYLYKEELIVTGTEQNIAITGDDSGVSGTLVGEAGVLSLLKIYVLRN